MNHQPKPPLTVRLRERLAEQAPSPVRAVGHTVFQAGRRIGYVRAGWPRPVGTRPPLHLTASTMFRNEAPYLAEWITFHRLQGVEEFWLYDNNSDDNWREVLAPELESGVVKVTPWPHHPGQMAAFADCLTRHRQDARWIAFIDVDEFLFSPTGRPLPEVLSRFRNAPGVYANWRVFGLPEDGSRADALVTERHLWRVRDDRFWSKHVKSVVYPRQVVAPITSHVFRYKHGHGVGETGAPQHTDLRDPATADLLRINHYVARSLADSRYKRTRSDPYTGGESLRMTAHDPEAEEVQVVDGIPVPRDEVRDDAILQFVPALKDALARRPEPKPISR